MRVVSTWGSRFSCSSAALNRATTTAGSLVASLANACASCGCVVTLPLPYMSSANPTYPASARRRAWLRACSLCPHHSCTTSTPGRLPRAASSQAMNPCNTVSPWRYSISRVCTVALPADMVSKTAVIANPYRVYMPRPPGGWYNLRPEARPERRAVRRRRPIVARDQVRPIVPDVPHPGEVAPLPGVHPVHQRRDESAAAIVLAELPEHERHLLRHRRRIRIPARGRVAPAEVVDVPRRGQVVERIARLVREPVRQPRGVLDAAEHDHVGGAGAADRVHQLLHPGGLEGHAAASAAVPPATPRLRRVGVAVGERLVEQVEDHAIVALVRRGDLPPELRRVVAVRHRGLAERLARIGGPVQVQDHDEPGAVRQRDVVGDSTAVVGPRVGGGDAVDAEPAGLVQGQAHHIRLPGCDRLHGRRVGRSIEDAPALRAGVLRSGAVHPAQPHRASEGVHQSGTLHVYGGGAQGLGRRGRGRGRGRRSAARGSGPAAGERTERHQHDQTNAHSATAGPQAVVSARASDRTRNATTRCTAPTTSANHAISASTVVTVSRGYTTAAAASARVRNPPSTLQPGAAPIAFWARASRNCTMLAISIHNDTDTTMYASDRVG